MSKMFEAWPLRTARVKQRSTLLKALDGAVATIAKLGPGVGDIHLLAAGERLEDWRNGASSGEKTMLVAEADELDADIASSFSRSKSQLTNVVANAVKPSGWVYRPWDAVNYPWTSALALPLRLNPTLSTAENMRMNEAIRRAKLACTYARDAMIRIAGGGGSNQDLQAYADYFGATDKGRISRVRQNYLVLALAFQQGPTVVDVRNTQYGLTCYAACFRNSIASTYQTGTGGQGGLSVTSSVEMFLGRAFYQHGNYEKTSEDTVGTLVHEFAHGAINAVDVPPVDSTGAWTHTRVSDNPGDNDFGSSTDNSIQASTPATVKLLAQFQPDYSVVNADSYGQFAVAMLVQNKG